MSLKSTYFFTSLVDPPQQSENEDSPHMYAEYRNDFDKTLTPFALFKKTATFGMRDGHNYYLIDIKRNQRRQRTSTCGISEFSV